MGQKLLTLLVVLGASVASAQYGGNIRPGYQNVGPAYARPYVDNNYRGNDPDYNESQDTSNNYTNGADTSQIDNFKGANDASNTQSSPQINIYNANSNANKQKAATTSAADGYANANSQLDYNNQYGSNLSNVRRNLEYQVNDAAVNQLEYSRIEDERYRAQKVFNTSYSNGAYGGGYNNGNNYNNNNDGYNNGGAAYGTGANYNNGGSYGNNSYGSNSNYATSNYSYFGYDSFFVGPTLAFMNPPDNITGDVGYGLQFGTNYATGFSFNGTFLYSNIEMSPYSSELIDGQYSPAYQDVDQYTLGLGLNYNFGVGYGITPFIGANLAFTYRDFQNPWNNGGYGGGRYSNDSTSSTALDGGLVVGVDVRVSRTLSVSLAYTFMSNITFERDSDNTYYGGSQYSNGYGGGGYRNNGYNGNGNYGRYGGYNNYSDPIEAQNKQILMLTAKWSIY